MRTFLKPVPHAIFRKAAAAAARIKKEGRRRQSFPALPATVTTRKTSGHRIVELRPPKSHRVSPTRQTVAAARRGGGTRARTLGLPPEQTFPEKGVQHQTEESLLADLLFQHSIRSRCHDSSPPAGYSLFCHLKPDGSFRYGLLRARPGKVPFPKVSRLPGSPPLSPARRRSGFWRVGGGRIEIGIGGDDTSLRCRPPFSRSSRRTRTRRALGAKGRAQPVLVTPPARE